MSITRRVAVGGLAALPFVHGRAQAQQNFPSKPMTLVVPFPAGGPADIFGRNLAERMSALLGQPVLVENKSGAAGVTGIDDCVNSGRYSEYVTTMTEKTPVQPGAGGIGTPTIAINGQVIANSTLPQPADLASLFTGSSTPSPTATP